MTTVGVYRAYNATGAPAQGAAYRVTVSRLYDGSDNILIQNAINKLNEAYHRTKYGSGEWTSWIKY